MLIVRFYPVMGTLCCEATSYDNVDPGSVTRRASMGRTYRHIEGEASTDDLWGAFYDLLKYNRNDGCYDEPCHWFE